MSITKPVSVLCVCQIGVGSSVMLRVFVDKALVALGVENRKIEISDAATAGGLALVSDVIITNYELEDVVKKYGKPVIALEDMTSHQEIKDRLAEFLETF